MSAYIRWPSNNASLPTYANFAALPALANDGSVAVTTDTDTIYVYNSGTTTWLPVAGPGTVFSIGTIDTGSPSANGAHITSGALILQSASATMPGLMNLTTQTIAGNKTFTGTLAASNLSGTNTGNVTLTAVGASGNANGASLSGQALTLQPASASFPGVLTAADWTTFNSKVSTTRAINTTSPLTGGGDLSADRTIAIPAATTSVNGYLTSTDWNTFNGKQAAGNYITALTGDGTAAGPGSAALTLATVNSNVGSFGSASTSLTASVNAKGLVTAMSSQAIQIAESQVTNLVSDLAGKQPVGNYITALTGDATASGPGSAALTLATVNANVGSFGSASAVTALTVNAKGLVTAAASTSIAIAASQITSGQLPIGNGGTGATTKAAAFDALSPMSASGDIIYGGASGTGTRLAKGSDGTFLKLASGIPAWTAATTPTVQTLTSTGTTTGYLFTVTSANATVGATYTNNSVTFTVLATISGATKLFTSSGGAPAASGTLTKATGSGDATITFSANVPLATYTTPANAAYLNVKLVGAGGGGGGSATVAANNSGSGTTGGSTAFGAGLLLANGGTPGIGSNGTNSNGVGGTTTVASPAIAVLSLRGGAGNDNIQTVASNAFAGASGGQAAYFAAYGVAVTNGSGSVGPSNTGAGGAGGGTGLTASYTGGGGGSGGFIEAIIPTPGATYVYAIGAGGSAGSAGTSGNAGGGGGSGVIIVTEYYQ